MSNFRFTLGSSGGSARPNIAAPLCIFRATFLNRPAKDASCSGVKGFCETLLNSSVADSKGDAFFPEPQGDVFFADFTAFVADMGDVC